MTYSLIPGRPRILHAILKEAESTIDRVKRQSAYQQAIDSASDRAWKSMYNQSPTREVASPTTQLVKNLAGRGANYLGRGANWAYDNLSDLFNAPSLHSDLKQVTQKLKRKGDEVATAAREKARKELAWAKPPADTLAPAAGTAAKSQNINRIGKETGEFSFGPKGSIFHHAQDDVPSRRIMGPEQAKAFLKAQGISSLEQFRHAAKANVKELPSDKRPANRKFKRDLWLHMNDPGHNDPKSLKRFCDATTPQRMYMMGFGQKNLIDKMKADTYKSDEVKDVADNMLIYGSKGWMKYPTQVSNAISATMNSNTTPALRAQEYENRKKLATQTAVTRKARKFDPHFGHTNKLDTPQQEKLKTRGQNIRYRKEDAYDAALGRKEDAFALDSAARNEHKLNITQPKTIMEHAYNKQSAPYSEDEAYADALDIYRRNLGRRGDNNSDLETYGNKPQRKGEISEEGVESFSGGPLLHRPQQKPGWEELDEAKSQARAERRDQTKATEMYNWDKRHGFGLFDPVKPPATRSAPQQTAIQKPVSTEGFI